MTTTSARSVFMIGVLLAFVALAPLGVTAVCLTPLADMTPAASTTVTVQAGECAGNIKIIHDNVKINILTGAEPFQAGKSIVLPTTGVIVDFQLDVTSVVWAVSQQLFSGGSATLLELRGASIAFKDSAITSNVSDPIGFDGKLTTGSRYTLNTTTLSVMTDGSGVELTGAISGSSTVALNSSSIIVSGSGSCYGLKLTGAFAGSTLSITHGSQVNATSPNSVWFGRADAHAIWFAAAVTDSTLEMTHGSALMASSNYYYAYGIRFNAAFTGSTLSITNGSVQATSSSKDAVAIFFVAGFTGSTLCRGDGSVVTATAPSGTGYTILPSTIENECSDTPEPTSTSSSSGSTGNGASSMTAAALGLMTLVLAMF